MVLWRHRSPIEAVAAPPGGRERTSCIWARAREGSQFCLQHAKVWRAGEMYSRRKPPNRRAVSGPSRGMGSCFRVLRPAFACCSATGFKLGPGEGGIAQCWRQLDGRPAAPPRLLEWRQEPRVGDSAIFSDVCGWLAASASAKSQARSPQRVVLGRAPRAPRPIGTSRAAG